MKNKTLFYLYFSILILYIIVEFILFTPYDRDFSEYLVVNSNKIFQQVLSVLLIVISGYFCISRFNQVTNIPQYRYFYLFGLYATLSFVFYNISLFSLFFFSQYLKIIYWILPLTFFHITFLKMESLTVKKILQAFVIIYIFQSLAMIIKGYSSIQFKDDTIYALGANIPFILPLLFSVFTKRKVRWLYLLCLAISVISLKRVPVILTLVAAIFFYKELLKGVKIFEIVIIVGIILFSGVLSFLLDFLFQILDRNSAELASDSFGSGRSVFYMIILDQFADNSLLSQLFGNGLSSVNKLLYASFGIPIAAHNGYLQALYDYGLIGLGLYLLIFYQLIRQIKEVKRYSPYYKQFVMFIAIWMIQNFITHGYSGTDFIAFSLFLALVFSRVATIKRIKYDTKQARFKKIFSE